MDAYYMVKVRAIIIAIDGLMSKMRMSFEEACSVFDLTKFRMSDIKKTMLNIKKKRQERSKRVQDRQGAEDIDIILCTLMCSVTLCMTSL